MLILRVILYTVKINNYIVPFKMKVLSTGREMGLKRRETVWSLSDMSAGISRDLLFRTRGTRAVGLWSASYSCLIATVVAG